MSDGGVIIIIAAAVIVAALIAIIYVIDTWPRRIVPDEPYGDASDTPTVIHNARRVNHKVAND
tara:strand:+ start:697 stop:885 length:189 start_codon:yes stop_codon:yes gene_type:complete